MRSSAVRAKPPWLYEGTAVLVLLCTSVFWANAMTPVTPMPLHQVLLAWTTIVGPLFVLPAVYFVTLLWLWDKAYFGLIVLLIALAFSLLSVFYFISAWEYGIDYQGRGHTLTVAVENAIGFTAALALAFIGYRTGAKGRQIAAHFLVFALLSWCAFPYLGEAP